jgi:hypothetical protein
VLDSPKGVCAGEAGFEYPATFVLFSTKEKPGFWTRQRAFEQVKDGSNIQLLSFSLV